MKRFILFFITIFSISTIAAQEPEVIKFQSYRDSSGVLFWNLKLPVYLSISSSPSGNSEQLKNDNQAEYTQPYFFEKEGLNTFFTQGGINNKTSKTNTKINISYPVIVDGSTPKTKMLFLNAISGSNNKSAYYGPGLEIQMVSTDKYVGVKQIYYSLNGESFKKYNSIFTIAQEGEYNLKYYAIDFVGNREEIKTVVFRVDTKVPETKHRIVGEYIPELETLSERSKIELLPLDTASEIKYTKYQIDKSKPKFYAGKSIPVRYLSNGYHTIKYFSADKVGNIEDTVSYKFYVDKVPPILTSDVLGDRFVVNDQIYFSGRTKFKLICVDNKSGIDSLKYSIDDEPYKDYTEAFYLPRIPGFHIVSYYAKDKFGNITRSESWENTKYHSYGYSVEKIYIDLVGPTVAAKFTGFYYFVNDTVLLGKDASILLYANDNESGMQYISYSLDDEREETKFEKPIKITTHGKHRLEYFAYDNVNNRNIGELTFYADFVPPVISHYFSIEAIGDESGVLSYPSNVKLYLAGTDVQVGTKIVEYSLNGAAKLPYIKAVKGFKRGEVNEITVYATDNLNNTSSVDIKFFVRKR